MHTLQPPDGIPHFSLRNTVTSGQTFRWLVAPPATEVSKPLSNPTTDTFYRPVSYEAQDFVFAVTQTDENTLKWTTCGSTEGVPVSIQETLLKHYLGYDYPYSDALEQLSERDAELHQTISPATVSIVRDDPFETAISFICSPQATIDRIYTMQRNLEQEYGTPIKTQHGTFFTFPKPTQLSSATDADLQDCNLGYRASYVRKTVQKIVNGEISIPPQSTTIETPKLSQQLQELVGVGQKVAECILLYSYWRSEVIPIDTRIQQMATARYDDSIETTTQAKTALHTKWGTDYAGYYQLLLYDLAATELTD